MHVQYTHIVKVGHGQMTVIELTRSLSRSLLSTHTHVQAKDNIETDDLAHRDLCVYISIHVYVESHARDDSNLFRMRKDERF